MTVLEISLAVGRRTLYPLGQVRILDPQPTEIGATLSVKESLQSLQKRGSLSNSVEIGSRRYEPQQHLPPVDLHVFQTIGDAFQHLSLQSSVNGLK